MTPLAHDFAFDAGELTRTSALAVHVTFIELTPLFILEQASFSVLGRVLLEPLSMTLTVRRIVGLIGHNGSGKSTLVKGLARQQPASVGTSKDFAAHVVALLVKGGVLVSHRGLRCGGSLARPAQIIQLGEVLRRQRPISIRKNQLPRTSIFPWLSLVTPSSASTPRNGVLSRHLE